MLHRNMLAVKNRQKAKVKGDISTRHILIKKNEGPQREPSNKIFKSELIGMKNLQYWKTKYNIHGLTSIS